MFSGFTNSQTVSYQEVNFGNWQQTVGRQPRNQRSNSLFFNKLPMITFVI